MPPISDQYRERISILAALSMLVLLIGFTIAVPPEQPDLLAGLLFCALIVFTLTFAVPFAGGSVSLMPMTVNAAYLVIGLVPVGWITFAGAIIHGWIRHRWGKGSSDQGDLDDGSLVARTATNATMHPASILAGGAVFQLTGGSTPLSAVDISTLLRLVPLGLTYLGVNYLLAGVYFATQRREQLRAYLRSLHKVIFFEGAPLIFSVLVALTFNQLGLGFFLLLAFNLVVGSLIAHNLDLTNRRLGRRVKELDGLQVLGQALSTSLGIENVVSTIYTQVARLMEARELFVALYDPQTDELTFPLAVEKGQRVQWRSRRAGNGLTEYVLRTRAPLLISKDVQRKTAELGLVNMGREVACWLGVPILAGTEPLGVIALQSYTTPNAYDSSHQNLLVTIAAQAAAAIQNARLYARTDEALSHRVQELDSILRTSRDGFLLLDLDWNVLTVNRTLADWVKVAQSELTRQRVDASPPDREPLIRLIGYTPNALRDDCQALAEGQVAQKQAIILLGPSMRHSERTLIPVRDQEGAITGWLLAFRDMTEEIELARLKDDMTEMLVHDLRSPLTAVMGSLALLKRPFDQRDEQAFERFLTMAEQNSDRIMRMVNQLLDISRLESDQLPIRSKPVAVDTLFRDAEARFVPLATEAEIKLVIQISPVLPLLYVDPGLISRVIDNLLDNAIKFTPDGGEIQLWARSDRKAGPDAMLLGVSDTGPGIPLEAQSQLFTKFQQITPIEGRRGGTGLGLAFCRLVVEAHGGRIWVESEVGKGSTFVMALPTGKTQAQR